MSYRAEQAAAYLNGVVIGMGCVWGNRIYIAAVVLFAVWCLLRIIKYGKENPWHN